MVNPPTSFAPGRGPGDALRNSYNFAPLQDMDEFKRSRVDPELQTIAWENGADLAPEFLYAQMKALA